MTLAGVPGQWEKFLNGAIIIIALAASRYASREEQD